MRRELISMQEILGLLSETQKAQYRSKAQSSSKSNNDLQKYKARREQQRLLGVTLSGTKSTNLSKEIKEDLWNKVHSNQHQSSNKEAANAILNKIHKRYKRKNIRHWYISSALVVSLLVVMIGSGIFDTNIESHQVNSSYTVLTSNENNATWYVEVRDDNITLIPISKYSKSAENDLELWAITYSQQVISLGVISEGDVMKLDTMTVSRLDNSEIKTIAISVENLGGSVSGKPEGKVIYANDVMTIT